MKIYVIESYGSIEEDLGAFLVKEVAERAVEALNDEEGLEADEQSFFEVIEMELR